MKHKKLMISICIIAVAAIMAVVGFIVLPETLVVQINTAGQPANTLPKVFGILIPFLICVVSAIMYLKIEKGAKSLVVSLVGVLVFALLFLFTL